MASLAAKSMNELVALNWLWALLYSRLRSFESKFIRSVIRHIYQTYISLKSSWEIDRKCHLYNGGKKQFPSYVVTKNIWSKNSGWNIVIMSCYSMWISKMSDFEFEQLFWIKNQTQNRFKLTAFWSLISILSKQRTMKTKSKVIPSNLLLQLFDHFVIFFFLILKLL